MVDLHNVMMAARLKRFTHLLATRHHPIADLQEALGAKDHLRERAVLDIEDITSSIMSLLHRHYLQAYSLMSREAVTDDLITHRAILRCKIKDMVMPIRINSIEMAALRRKGIQTVTEAILDGRNSMNLLKRVAHIELRTILDELTVTYAGGQLPDDGDAVYIQDSVALQWHRPEQLSTRQIWLLLYRDELINETKLLKLTEDGAVTLYRKIAKLRNVANRAKILRFLHGDVYCKERLFRFGLAEDSTCGRCFGTETIQHLLIQCPYSAEVWGRLGIMPTQVQDVLHERLSLSELEIRAELISSLVFRKKVIPPEVLIRSVLISFQKGLSGRTKTRDYAEGIVERYELTGQWF